MYKLHTERKGRQARWLDRANRSSSGSGAIWQVPEQTVYGKFNITFRPSNLTAASDVRLEMQRSADGVSGWTMVCTASFGEPNSTRGWWMNFEPLVLEAGYYRVWSNVSGQAVDFAVDGDLIP